MKISDLPVIQPQLPTFISTENFTARWNINYSYEIKFDGICAILYWTREEGCLFQSRTEKKITNLYSSFLQDIHNYLTKNTKFQALILHGELIAVDEQHPGGNLPALQLRKSVRCILQYRIFDLLYGNDKDLRGLSYRTRRKAIEQYFNIPSAYIKVVPARDNKDNLPKWPNLEGFVAKNIASPYLGDRQKAWLKIKPREGKDFICIGYEPGQGRLVNTVGSLLLAELVDGDLKTVGKVGTGFSDDLRAVVDQWISKNCTQEWTPFMVEVNYARRTTDNQLWHPSAVRVKFPNE